MKSRTVKVLLLAVSLAFGHAVPGVCGAVQTDPFLTSAIITQMEMLKKIYARRDSTQKKIIAAEGAVTVAMGQMHAVEQKMLDYMSNVSNAFQNLYQIKRAGELVAVEIPASMAEVRRAIGAGHFEGTAVAVLAGQQIADMTEQMMSLYPFMKQLVTSGSYSTGEKDENGKDVKKKVNLLDSYERYYICSTVVGSLESINGSLQLLAWEIRCMRWKDLVYALDPLGWDYIINMEYIVKYAVNEWNYQLHNY